MRRFTAAVLATTLLTAGCASGSNPLHETGRKNRSPYAGPLYRPPPGGDRSSWTGAAGAVVRCSSAPSGGSSPSPYSEGSVGRSADDALDDADTVAGVEVALLHVERKEATRILYTTVYGGVARQALVMHYGAAAPGTGADAQGKGWYPESWASCDWSDFPERVSAAKHVQVWTDRDGHRVDTRKVTSSGSGCLGEASLNVGVRLFERAPLTELSAYFVERYRADLPLPADAVDTGWSRGSRHLWLSRTRHRAYVGATAAHVEYWPELTKATGCA